MAAKKIAAKVVDEALDAFHAEVAQLSALEHRAMALVHKWRAEHLMNNVFSQDTGAWNILHEKLPHLIRAIVEEIG